MLSSSSLWTGYRNYVGMLLRQWPLCILCCCCGCVKICPVHRRVGVAQRLCRSGYVGPTIWLRHGVVRVMLLQ